MHGAGLPAPLAAEVEGERPVGPVERLEQQLDLAVALEEYEEAARIRDQLRRLAGGPDRTAALRVLNTRASPQGCRRGNVSAISPGRS